MSATNRLMPFHPIKLVLGGAILLAFSSLTIAAAGPPGDVIFRTPSGNIGCRAYFSPQIWLRCDIIGVVNPLPPRPKDCQLDWGVGFGLPKTGTATVECAGDTTMDPQSRVIASGTTWRQGGFACNSETSALRCSNKDGHGFFLSKQHSYRF
jgi:hypothetical protein